MHIWNTQLVPHQLLNYRRVKEGVLPQGLQDVLPKSMSVLPQNQEHHLYGAFARWRLLASLSINAPILFLPMQANSLWIPSQYMCSVHHLLSFLRSRAHLLFPLSFPFLCLAPCKRHSVKAQMEMPKFVQAAELYCFTAANMHHSSTFSFGSIRSTGLVVLNSLTERASTSLRKIICVQRTRVDISKSITFQTKIFQIADLHC